MSTLTNPKGKKKMKGEEEERGKVRFSLCIVRQPVKHFRLRTY